MLESEKFRRWVVDDTNLVNLDPLQVRDLLVECFYAAQRGMFRHLKEKAGLLISEEDIRMRATSLVRLAFNKVGGDFNKPSKESLLRAMDYLAEIETSWGTPMDVVMHNARAMKQIIDRL